MEYRVAGGTHSLNMDKDELITLVALIHEGLERLDEKSKSGTFMASSKLESAQSFVTQLNRKIMSA
jgi:hypothetical protein